MQACIAFFMVKMVSNMDHGRVQRTTKIDNIVQRGVYLDMMVNRQLFLSMIN